MDEFNEALYMLLKSKFTNLVNLDAQRSKLNSIPNFEPYTFFKQLKGSEENHITFNFLMRLCKKYNLTTSYDELSKSHYISEQIVNSLIVAYDSERESKLNYEK